MYIVSQQAFHKFADISELCLRSSGFTVTDETWQQEALYAPYTRLYYVVDGRGILFSEKEEMVLEPGYAYIAPCGLKYGFYGEKSVTKLYFHINLILSEEGYDAFSECNRFIRIPFSVSRLESMKEWYFSTDPYDLMLLKNELYQTISYALQVIRSERETAPVYSSATSFAIGYIYRNLSARLSASEVAEKSYCSQSKLALLFRREVGQSIANYIDELLMAEAKHKLIYSKDSIGMISEQLGFCDQFYFSRKFTKRFGVSPLQFRKKEKL